MTECLNDSKITLNVPTTILLKDMGLVARSKRACLEEFDNYNRGFAETFWFC